MKAKIMRANTRVYTYKFDGREEVPISAVIATANHCGNSLNYNAANDVVYVDGYQKSLSDTVRDNDLIIIAAKIKGN